MWEKHHGKAPNKNLKYAYWNKGLVSVQSQMYLFSVKSWLLKLIFFSVNLDLFCCTEGNSGIHVTSLHVTSLMRQFCGIFVWSRLVSSVSLGIVMLKYQQIGHQWTSLNRLCWISEVPLDCCWGCQTINNVFNFLTSVPVLCYSTSQPCWSAACLLWLRCWSQSQ